jgi:CheY-like chemotaxis protein
MNAAEHTILLVEDNGSDVMLIKRAFARAKVANPIQVISDGDAAVEYLKGDGAFADRVRYPLPVLILLDLKLPRRSGLEVLAWLRDQESLRRIPVVILTSSNGPKDINGAYDLGANSYLVKPVEFDALYEMLKNVNLYWLMINQNPDVGPASV